MSVKPTELLLLQGQHETKAPDSPKLSPASDVSYKRIYDARFVKARKSFYSMLEKFKLILKKLTIRCNLLFHNYTRAVADYYYFELKEVRPSISGEWQRAQLDGVNPNALFLKGNNLVKEVEHVKGNKQK